MNLSFDTTSPLSNIDMKQFTSDIEEIRAYTKTIDTNEQMNHFTWIVRGSPNCFERLGSYLH